MKLIQIDRENRIKIYRKYLQEIGFGIDGYYETTMIDEKCYFLFENVNKGVISIHEERGLTGFYIFKEYIDEYETLLDYVLSLREVTKMLFTDCDRQLFKSIQKRGFKIEMQAFNFGLEKTIDTDYKMELAIVENIELYIRVFGDFVLDYKRRIDNNELYIKYDSNGYPISLGAYEPMILNPKKACVSMKVSNKYLRKGYGLQTVLFIIKTLQDKGIEPNARCWYLNEISKKTLLKSGFKVSNHLLRVESF